MLIDMEDGSWERSGGEGGERGLGEVKPSNLQSARFVVFGAEVLLACLLDLRTHLTHGARQGLE